ncbi:hypothetical protein SGGMMB4_05705 [Sodalis glossinidius str. 'morsitans']|uniref:Uncharacterized protein n=1 Tax=Sodalis glossinidius (strain morsitans) TaxID=343509 RepID=A0A193QNW1_SODGM|nr:hypothetical protein SGGMMB4_05705 [Sodalis glossinidius str. 'morsitans']
MLIRNGVVTLMVSVWPILRPTSWRNKRPYFLPQQSIMTVAGIVSAISQRFPDFPLGLVYQSLVGPEHPSYR